MSYTILPAISRISKNMWLIFMSAPCTNDKQFIIQLMHNIKFVDTIKVIKCLKVLQHVSDHRRSIIRELVQCLAKNYKNGSIVSVDMEKVGVMVAMAACSDPLCVCM